MSQANDRAGLIADLAWLAQKGSSDEVLEACTTLLSLPPVAIAVSEGAFGPEAARTLLELVAKEADTTKNVQAAAGLTGIDPRHDGHGVRDDPGPGPRQRRAGVILGRSEKTVRSNQHRYIGEYANAVASFVRATSRDPDLMAAYLRECGVSGHEAARLVGHLAEAPTVPAQQPRPNDPQSGERVTAHLARHIPLSGVVGQALDAARTSCKARGRALYTPDLLLALLDLPRSRAADCFEQAEPGLARRVREWLSRTVAELNMAHADPFQRFEWTERADVQLAQDLAALDGSAVVTEIYLLLGVLGSESGTRGRLVKFLGPDGYDRLAEVASARRRHALRVLKTPGPDSGFDHSD